MIHSNGRYLIYFRTTRKHPMQSYLFHFWHVAVATCVLHTYTLYMRRECTDSTMEHRSFYIAPIFNGKCEIFFSNSLKIAKKSFECCTYTVIQIRFIGNGDVILFWKILCMRRGKSKYTQLLSELKTFFFLSAQNCMEFCFVHMNEYYKWGTLIPLSGVVYMLTKNCHIRFGSIYLSRSFAVIVRVDREELKFLV